MIQIPLALVAASLPGAKSKGRPDVWVRRVVTDSRDVQAGDLFACLRGKNMDGHKFALAAIRRGAAGLLIDRPVPGLDPETVGVITVPRVLPALTWLAPRFYNYPSARLRLVGITGTNGKTTTTYMLRSILQQQKIGSRPIHRIGLMGTVQHMVDQKIVQARNTTPMAWEVQGLLAEMVEAGCDTAVMEVSSHALAEGRVGECEFDVAVFTNLTQDHLDYHRTMGQYAAAKRRLFAQLARPGSKQNKKVAVVNLDDPYAQSMAQAAPTAQILTYALSRQADFTATDIRYSPRGTVFRIKTPQGTAEITLRMLGEYNIYNALAAAAAAYGLGAGLPVIQKGLQALRQVPGRVEKISVGQPFTVLVDYAHTPDGLEKILLTARAITRRRLLVLFGCGGERDRSKRPVMGAVAARLADVAMLTSDNPRHEDPKQIIREVAVGFKQEAGLENRPVKHYVQIDRKRAIDQILELAEPGDTVVLAGKGHEKIQVLKDKTIAFDDRQVARAFLTQLGRRRKWKK